jgi:hypothetical protein
MLKKIGEKKISQDALAKSSGNFGIVRLPRKILKVRNFHFCPPKICAGL